MEILRILKYLYDSERGVRRVPELLPEDYTPTNGYHSKPNSH
jgi:hypothetical protein